MGNPSAKTLKQARMVVRRLEKELRRFRNAGKEGMIEAGLKVQAESQKRTPILTGNLRASAFTIWAGKTVGPAPHFRRKPAIEAEIVKGYKARNLPKLTADWKYVQAKYRQRAGGPLGWNKTGARVFVGHSAYYAVYVHNNAQMKHRTGSSHFLLLGLAKVAPQIPQMIRLAWLKKHDFPRFLEEKDKGYKWSTGGGEE